MGKMYLMPTEAADYIGVSKSLLSQPRQRGTGCNDIHIGDVKTKAAILYNHTDLDQWLEQYHILTQVVRDN